MGKAGRVEGRKKGKGGKGDGLRVGIGEWLWVEKGLRVKDGVRGLRVGRGVKGVS